MIQLFNVSNHNIDTSKFSNLLHDGVVEEFEKTIADYVGAKYAVAVSSATAGLHLSYMALGICEKKKIITAFIKKLSSQKNIKITYKKINSDINFKDKENIQRMMHQNENKFTRVMIFRRK